jgi:pimeloyl-ACP methyl ester carboxylesterase
VIERLELKTLDGAKEPSFAPCAFAEGRSDEAPSCSAALVLATTLERFHREARTGVCDTGRYRLRFHAWGEGPPLIFVHGLCDDAETFVLPMGRLSEHYCCISYDLPTGRGDGARLGGYRHVDLVADLLALCDHLRVPRTYVLGSSFGSTVVLAALAEQPERFAAGIVQGGFAHRPLAWTEVLLSRFARYWPGSVGRLPLWRAILERSHAAEFAELEPARWPFFLEHHGAARNSAVAHRALLLHQVDLRPLLPQIRQPVLVVCGDRDRLVGRPCEETLVAGLPNVARGEIEGCGHLPQFTHPEVFAEMVQQFLGKVSGPS